MKRKLVSMALVACMLASVTAGCGSKGGSTEAGKGGNGSSEFTGTATDDGKTLNIYVWNEEFKTRVAELYPGYEEVDATHGKIGDVEVNWNITPSDDNAYQENLDSMLEKQETASADDKIDIFLLEADYALKYVDTEYTLPLKTLGIEDSALSKQYQYTKDVVTDSNGILKGSSWQACPGVLFYNRDVAKEVLGTEDPEEVQEFVKDWDTFKDTASKMKDAGYSMTSSVMDTYRVYSNNVTSKAVEGNKINVDENIMNWINDSKELYDMGATGTHALWGDDWSKGFYPEGKVFCYFGPAWLVNFCMAADQEGSIGNLGKWGAATGPQGFFWGGTWIAAANNTDNSSLVKDIILKLTADDATMTEIVKKYDDYVNNVDVMTAMASDSEYHSDILGGQNPIAMYNAGVQTIDLSNVSAYDSGFNIDLQGAITDYFKGTCTLDEAMDAFHKAMTERYPELEY